jgi:raffinose/stachyose/melibiose transport system substrate-binding protein
VKQAKVYLWRAANTQSTPTIVPLPLSSVAVAAKNESLVKPQTSLSRLDGQQITFAHYRSEERDFFDILAAEFKVETGITVTQVVYPTQQYQAIAGQVVRSGEVGDVFVTFPGGQFINFLKAGQFADLSNQPLVQRFEERYLDVGAADGKQFALPYRIAFTMPLYNADIFARLRLTPPENFPETLEMCRTLKKYDYIPMVFAGADTGGPQFLNAIGMAAPYSDPFGKIDRGEAKLTEKWFVEELKAFKKVADECFQPNAVATRNDGAFALFASEKAAILPTVTSHAPNVRLAGAKFRMAVQQLNLQPADQQKRYNGIYNPAFFLAINAASKKQAAALAWIEFLTRANVAERMADETLNQIPLKGLRYRSKDLQTLSWDLRTARLSPRLNVANNDVRLAIENTLNAVIGGKSPEQATQEAQNAIDRAQGK